MGSSFSVVMSSWIGIIRSQPIIHTDNDYIGSFGQCFQAIILTITTTNNKTA